jgi:hypothetical protein
VPDQVCNLILMFALLKRMNVTEQAIVLLSVTNTAPARNNAGRAGTRPAPTKETL